MVILTTSKGRLDSSTLNLRGCSGLTYPDMALTLEISREFSYFATQSHDIGSPHSRISGTRSVGIFEEHWSYISNLI